MTRIKRYGESSKRKVTQEIEDGKFNHNAALIEAFGIPGYPNLSFTEKLRRNFQTDCFKVSFELLPLFPFRELPELFPDEEFLSQSR